MIKLDYDYFEKEVEVTEQDYADYIRDFRGYDEKTAKAVAKEVLLQLGEYGVKLDEFASDDTGFNSWLKDQWSDVARDEYGRAYPDKGDELGEIEHEKRVDDEVDEYYRNGGK